MDLTVPAAGVPADARNAFGRAVDADPNFAAAHYNLSFVLSQLGDFDGALRETRRALELEPVFRPTPAPRSGAAAEPPTVSSGVRCCSTPRSRCSGWS